MNYFSQKELACPCCGECLLMGGFLDKLNNLRETLGHPLVVTSGCRCPKHNQFVGGAKKSLHLINSKETTGMSGACAVDVSTRGWSDEKRATFLKTVRERGYSVGVAKTFIHIDRRTDYPESGWTRRAEWTYG
jgi:uncharacterized protein YcbK (DUF882 family)